MTADEVAAMEKNAGEGGLGEADINSTPVSKPNANSNSGSKRKAGAADDDTPAKKAKTQRPSESAEESEDLEDDEDGDDDG